jgi:hypothetical protein
LVNYRFVLVKNFAAGWANSKVLPKLLLLFFRQLARSRNGAELEELVMGFAM